MFPRFWELLHKNAVFGSCVGNLWTILKKSGLHSEILRDLRAHPASRDSPLSGAAAAAFAKTPARTPSGQKEKPKNFKVRFNFIQLTTWVQLF